MNTDTKMIFKPFKFAETEFIESRKPKMSIDKTYNKGIVAEAVFQIRNVSKIYRMGEVEVHALRSVDLDLFEGESG